MPSHGVITPLPSLWSAFALTDFFATDITNQRLLRPSIQRRRRFQLARRVDGHIGKSKAGGRRPPAAIIGQHMASSRQAIFLPKLAANTVLDFPRYRPANQRSACRAPPRAHRTMASAASLVRLPTTPHLTEFTDRIAQARSPSESSCLARVCLEMASAQCPRPPPACPCKRPTGGPPCSDAMFVPDGW